MGTFYAPSLEVTQEDGTEEVQPDVTKMDGSVLASWKARLSQLDHPAMVARYADVLWDLSQTIAPTLPREFKIGQTAVDAYQQAAKEGLSHTPTLDLQRALDIAVELNEAGRIDAVCDQLLTLSEQAPMNHIGIWISAAHAFEGKNKVSEVHRKRMICGLEARLVNAASLPNGYAAQSAGNALLKVYKRNVNIEDRNRVLRVIAETYLRQSRKADAGVAIAWLQSIASLLEKEGLHDGAEVLRLEMEKRGPEAVAAMKTIEVEASIPFEEMDAQLEELISVEHPIVALVRLIYSLIPKCDSLRKRVKEMEKEFAFYSLIPRSIIGRDGIPKATIGSSENDMEGRMMEEVVYELQANFGLFILGFRKIKEKFGLTVEQIMEFAKLSSLTTGDMYKPLTEALTAYESGDYSKTISVLIPQLEAMLRELLKLLEIPTRKGIRNVEGVSELKNMNDVLSDERVNDTLENLVFFLRAVYIDKRALNLRNDFAHGDIPPEGFNEMTGSLLVMSLVALAAIGPHTIFRDNELAPEGSVATEEIDGSING